MYLLNDSSATIEKQEYKPHSKEPVFPQSISSSLKVANPLLFPEWNDWLLNSPNYSFFHSVNWARVLTDSYGYQPRYFINEGRNRFNALIPVMEINSAITGKRGVSLPFSDVCLPILAPELNRNTISKQILDYGQQAGWKSLEIRGDGFAPPDTQPTNYFVLHHVPLGDECNVDNVFSRFRNNFRTRIRKGLREGIQVHILRTPEAMREFYRLQCLTRKSKSLPPQPYQFFKNIYAHVIAEDLGFVILASHKGRIIAGGVFFHFGTKMIYKFGASNKAYQHFPANFLIIWNAIKWACENNKKCFCFGRSDTDLTGLLQFKDGWATKRKQLNYYKYNFSQQTFLQENRASTSHAYPLLDKLPISLLKFAGEILYRHIG